MKLFEVIRKYDGIYNITEVERSEKMRKIIFYKLNGKVKSEELLNKENLEHINGMMTKCTMLDGSEEVGFADPTGVQDKENYDGKIHDYIYLWTWDNLDEKTGDLIGDGDEKYNQTFKTVKINDIERVEVITYSNLRWGEKLTNKFEFYRNENEFASPKFLINKRKEEERNEYNQDKEKIYYYLTVKYEDYYSKKEYNYISDDTSVEIGDRVLVDMAGEVVIAEVLETAYCDKFDAPFPVYKTKKIITKVSEDFDTEDIEFYEELDSKTIDTIRMNINDTYFEFGILNYREGKDNDDNWNEIKINVHNSNFKYFKKSELMTSVEVEKILEMLEKLLNGELEEKEEIGFYEPDLEFYLYPKINLWNTGKYAYIKEGREIQDIYMELNINLTDRSGEYTGQRYVMIFNREEIEKITKYIKNVIG